MSSVKSKPLKLAIITYDQPVYALAKNVQWMQLQWFNECDCVIMLGLLHIEMAVLATRKSANQHSRRHWKLFERFRSSPSEVLLEKGVLEICSKFIGEHPCQCAISINLLCNFIEITLRHECSPVNLLHIFRAPFPSNTSGWLPLETQSSRDRGTAIKCCFQL